MNKEEVILVNENDQPIGVMEKMEAHEKGLLHRAFSVFIFNDKDEILLQQRALNKYHSPGLWTNTCCSHPRPTEKTIDAARRRLKEEMGIDCELQFKSSFVYKTVFSNGLTEHEFDHVFIGRFNDVPEINKNEVNDWRWKNLKEIKTELQNSPQTYTFWFKIAIEKLF